jgi:cation:H+ antiporter
MNDLALWIGVFIVAVIALVKSAEYFTLAAEKIGVFLGMPPFVVGVTIVGLGTSLPELTSSLVAVFAGAPEIVTANVIGSNITNIFLILGIAAVVGKRLKITHALDHVDMPLLVSSTLLFAFVAWDGVIVPTEALLLIAVLAVYLHFNNGQRKTSTAGKKIIPWVSFGMLIAAGVVLYFGAKYAVESVVQIASITSIGTEIIAVTAVALGTSLPELVVSAHAARRGKAEVAVGNILGSNIFNSLGVIGVPALLGPLVVPASMLTFGIPLMIGATAMYTFMTHSKEVTRWEGWVLIVFYLFFIGKSFALF